MRLADLEGRWRIKRQIDDHLPRRQGWFRGEAVFVPDGQGMAYCETGTLQFPGEPALQAERRYLWRERGNEIAVFFEDDRPFHNFSLAEPKPLARHDCDPDTYEVAYDFSGWPLWHTIWTVTGPHKNYRMTSHYSLVSD